MRALRTSCAMLLGILLGCACASGPSKEEVELRELREKLADMQQRRDDLRVHYKTVEARNRVLIGLVKGLTASAAGMADDGPLLVVTPAREQLAAIDRDLADLAGTMRKSRDAFAKLRDERASLNSQLDSAVRTIEETRKREEQALARGALFRDMIVRLRSINTAQLEVQVVRNRMLLQLPETLLFEPGQADVTGKGKALLDEVALMLQQIPDRELEIAGHTDSSPIRTARFPSNWHLSATRAVNVAQYLVAHGVDAKRLSAAGYADSRPVAEGADEASRRKNRRIEIVLLPNLDELPDLSELNSTPNPDGTTPSTPTTPVAPPTDPNAPILRIAPQ